MRTQIKENALTLTNDPRRVESLKRKLAEYAGRGYDRITEDQDPSALYRYLLLAQLLQHRIVDLDAFKAGCRVRSEADEAIEIIRGYNSGDTSLHYGGTGLA